MKMEASGDFYFISSEEEGSISTPTRSQPADGCLLSLLSYLVLGHGLELRGQGVVVGVVQESPPLLQTLADQLGLEFLIVFFVAWKYQRMTTRKWIIIHHSIWMRNEADVYQELPCFCYMSKSL